MKSLICMLVALVVGVYCGVIYTKAVEFEQRYPSRTVYDLRSFIAFAKGQHQYYADYPKKQNEWTGDSEWNLEVVDYYDEIEELLR